MNVHFQQNICVCLKRHADDEPLSGDHHLDHHHEEEGEELIDLKQNIPSMIEMTETWIDWANKNAPTCISPHSGLCLQG